MSSNYSSTASIRHIEDSWDRVDAVHKEIKWLNRQLEVCPDYERAKIESMIDYLESYTKRSTFTQWNADELVNRFRNKMELEVLFRRAIEAGERLDQAYADDSCDMSSDESEKPFGNASKEPSRLYVLCCRELVKAAKNYGSKDFQEDFLKYRDHYKHAFDNAERWIRN